MGTIQVSLAEAKRRVKAVEKALESGHPPPGIKTANDIEGAVKIAAQELDVDWSSLKRQIGSPNKGGLFDKHFGLRANWAKYKPRPPEPKLEPEPTVLEQDAVTRTRERIAIRDLVNENNKLIEQLIEAQDIRAGILGLLDPPLAPSIQIPKHIEHKGGRTVIIHLSDWHVGETVNIDEMGGVNSYSIDIFRRRAGRLADVSHALMTQHWKGDPPEKIVLIFGGDMITGEIHEELAITNDALSAPAVRCCAEVLAGLVKHLKQIAPIDIYTLPGNHGRLTKKPQSKGMAVNSFDTLISQIVEMMVVGTEGVRFFYPKSGDAVFNVYQWVFCAVHGDRIGSRGGQGFIGPVATIARGVHKMKSYYTSQGVIVHYFLIGHFHTTAKIPGAFSNGSLIGPSEYSRDLRANPEPSKQSMIIVHAERGVIAHEEIYCGDESEGAIYKAAT